MVTASVPPASPPRIPPPTGPSVEAWKAMDADAREAFLVRVLDALSDPRDLMGEGRPHLDAKLRALDLLRLHFNAMGRAVYIAMEMAVVYPSEESFSPDLLAVVDVPQIEDDQRMAWVVADEGKGIDLVLEVLHHGDRDKDLVRNVERYARLNIPEYFVYDRARQCIHGYRLSAPGSRQYQRVVPQGGRFTSTVLGIDLAVQGGTLRFFQGRAELFGSSGLINRLTDMVGSLETKADAEAERAQRETARADREALHAQQEAARAQQEAARADREALRAQQAQTGLRNGIFAALDARGVACPDALRTRVIACDDPATLQHWLLRALSAATAADALAD